MAIKIFYSISKKIMEYLGNKLEMSENPNEDSMNSYVRI